MANKNRLNKLFDKSAIEPSDTHPRKEEAIQADQQSEETLPVENPEESQKDRVEMSSDHEETAGEEPALLRDVDTTESAGTNAQDGSAAAGGNPEEESAEETLLSDTAEDSSTEDPLEAVRRSLIEEEESDKTQQESRWWRRFGRKAKKPEPEIETTPVEIDLPVTSDLTNTADGLGPTPEVEEDNDEIDDLIKALEAENNPVTIDSDIAPPVETAPEPAPEIDFEELKRQAFQARPEDQEKESVTDIRSIALEGGEEVLVEVESRGVDPMQERMSAVENAFKPYRKYIYTALALLGVAMAVTASLILFNVYQRSRPVPTTQPSNLPYPTAVSLPGGWSFPLGRGTLQNGRWEPDGAEWLEGTEVCRWVALPWSTQLEAVLRTLNPNDPIELSMSNNDKLVYEVYSIRQLTPAEMQELDSNSPCLLLILTQSEAEERWVLTALP
jgi:hypothetical protein